MLTKLLHFLLNETSLAPKVLADSPNETWGSWVTDWEELLQAREIVPVEIIFIVAGIGLIFYLVKAIRNKDRFALIGILSGVLVGGFLGMNVWSLIYSGLTFGFAFSASRPVWVDYAIFASFLFIPATIGVVTWLGVRIAKKAELKILNHPDEAVRQARLRKSLIVLWLIIFVWVLLSGWMTTQIRAIQQRKIVEKERQAAVAELRKNRHTINRVNVALSPNQQNFIIEIETQGSLMGEYSLDVILKDEVYRQTLFNLPRDLQIDKSIYREQFSIDYQTIISTYHQKVLNNQSVAILVDEDFDLTVTLTPPDEQHLLVDQEKESVKSVPVPVHFKIQGKQYTIL